MGVAAVATREARHHQAPLAARKQRRRDPLPDSLLEYTTLLAMHACQCHPGAIPRWQAPDWSCGLRRPLSFGARCHLHTALSTSDMPYHALSSPVSRIALQTKSWMRAAVCPLTSSSSVRTQTPWYELVRVVKRCHELSCLSLSSLPCSLLMPGCQDGVLRVP